MHASEFFSDRTFPKMSAFHWDRNDLLWEDHLHLNFKLVPFLQLGTGEGGSKPSLEFRHAHKELGPADVHTALLAHQVLCASRASTCLLSCSHSGEINCCYNLGNMSREVTNRIQSHQASIIQSVDLIFYSDLKICSSNHYQSTYCFG